MFCPNCGTQNPEVAETCSKCNFALKGVAAPKFKGTMLMMNQPQIPGVTPGVPASPPAAPGPVPPVPAPAAQRPPAPGAPPTPMMSSKLKGTMVGVAPMALPGQSGQAPVSVPSAFAARGSNVPPTPVPPPRGGHTESGSGFSPPGAQQGVNPLGGTVAADAGGFARPFGAGAQPGAAPAYPPQQAFPGAAPLAQGAPAQPYSPYGAPPPGTPPPGQQPVPMPYDASGYGAPPPNPYGAQQNPYGYGAYGPPPQQGYAQQPGAMTPYVQPGAMSPPGIGSAARMSALMPWLLPVSVIVVGVIVSIVLSMLGHPVLGLIVALLALAGGIATLVRVLKERSAPQ